MTRTAGKNKIKTLSERFCESNRLIPRRYFEYLVDDDAQRRAVLRHVHGERAWINNWKIKSKLITFRETHLVVRYIGILD